MGISPLVAHFTVFYGPCSPPSPAGGGGVRHHRGIVRGQLPGNLLGVHEAGRAQIHPPFIFITYPDILRFDLAGLEVFLISGWASPRSARACIGMGGWQRGPCWSWAP